MLYGISRPVGSQVGGIVYRLSLDDPSTNAWQLFAIGDVGQISTSPNGLAYDFDNQRLYFSVSRNGTNSLWFLQLQSDGASSTTVARAGTLFGEASNADFYDGTYWYIPQGSDNLRAVTLDSNGAALHDITHGAVTRNVKAYGFGDIAISETGKLWLLWGSSDDKELSTYDIARNSQYTVVRHGSPSDMAAFGQIAFASDNVLYNHDSGSGQLSVVDQTTGALTPVVNQPPAVTFGDIAGRRSCVARVSGPSTSTTVRTAIPVTESPTGPTTTNSPSNVSTTTVWIDLCQNGTYSARRTACACDIASCSSCMTIDGVPQGCAECTNFMFLVNGDCVAQCPAGFTPGLVRNTGSTCRRIVTTTVKPSSTTTVTSATTTAGGSSASTITTTTNAGTTRTTTRNSASTTTATGRGVTESPTTAHTTTTTTTTPHNGVTESPTTLPPTTLPTTTNAGVITG